MNKPYRLGIDMGSSSLGWCVASLDKNGAINEIIKTGVRIFPDGRDPKTKTPLCADRLLTRSASRNRDRRLQRKEALMKYLKLFGLMPKDASEAKKIELRNPYALRAKGVREKLSKHELGRALFHINMRRGFKSNRKGDRRADAGELDGMKGGINRLREELKGRTLGEYLYERCKSRKGARMRAESMDKKNSYEFYADRKMYEDEFNALWQTQSGFDKSLTEQTRAAIYEIIFTQRPLKIPELGKCTFERTEYRAYAAYETSQRFRIYQTVSNLEIVNLDSDNRLLTSAERAKIAEELIFRAPNMPKDNLLSFGKIKKLIGLPKDARFNLEASEKGLLCDITAKVMASDECFGSSWFDMPEDKTEEIIKEILNAEDDGKLAESLVEKFKIKKSVAENIAEMSLRLPAGTVRLSLKVMKKILPFLKEWNLYNKACELAGYNPIPKYKGELFDTLPYYGEILTASTIGSKPYADKLLDPEGYYGKITNPTVHVALNQLRKVVNKIIEIYGKPAEIVIETARDLPLGKDGLVKRGKEMEKNRDANEKIAEKLDALKVRNSYQNRMKYKIWESLSKDPKNRCCPFCGETIPLADLFSPKFEIEHLLPFSETFDDGMSNKVIACRACNRIKAKRTPFEAFGHVTKGKNKFDDILSRALLLGEHTYWRFNEDAMERFKEKNGDLIARMLCDTRYMSKVAREYLTCILPDNKIYTANGKATALLRGKWGLNGILDDGFASDKDAKKNRDDNRHHAIDAFVLACMSRKIIAEISRCAKIAEDAGLEKLVTGLPAPFEKFNYDIFREIIESIIVSFKPDTGGAQKAVLKNKTVGKLHNDTAYGFVKGSEDNGKITTTCRVKISALKFGESNVEQIADPNIRAALMDIYKDTVNTAGDEGGKKLWRERLEEFAASRGIRRLKIQKKNQELRGLIPMRDKAGKIYKYMANPENYCIDFYLPKGAKKWKFEIVNMFQAHKRGYIPEWKKSDSQAKLVMRLFKQDIVAYDDAQKNRVLARVTGIATNSQISLVPLNWSKVEGNPPKKGAATFQEMNARKVRVDEAGRLYDAGHARGA